MRVCSRSHRIATPPGGLSGYSLAELIIGLALGLCAVCLILPVVAGGLRLAAAQPSGADLDQRLRAVSSVVRTALEHAGLGPVAGEEPGALQARVPAVLPRRTGGPTPDPATSAWRDRLTVMAARRGAVAVPLAVAMASPDSLMTYDNGPPCPPLDGRCGFRPAQAALVDDRFATFDLARLTVAEPGILGVAPGALSKAYSPAASARVLPVEVTQLRYDVGRRQLRMADGFGNEMPFVDEVAGVEFEYFGDAHPPASPRPPLGTASCLFAADGTSLLPELAGGAGGPVRLGLNTLADGPFCGEGALRYDADLLRVRRIVARIRLAPATSVRQDGHGALARLIQQREVVVDVTFRNVPSGG